MSGTADRLTLAGITKRFGATWALTDAELSVARQSIHGVVGRNGAGKSTLVKIIAGELQPDAGELAIDGLSTFFKSPGDARAAGIAVVHQEMNLCAPLTPVENIFLGRERGDAGVLRWRSMKLEIMPLLERFSLVHVADVPVRHLTVAEQQRVEIVRALWGKASVMLFDEPNSALSVTETEALFAAIKEARDSGASILFVSHRLDEVLEVADSVTVLRDGKTIGTFAKEVTDVLRLARLMVGQELSDEQERGLDRPEPDDKRQYEPLLEAEDWTHAGHRFAGITLTLHRGEIVGLVGVEGSGARELIRSFYGLERAKGRIRIGGAERRIVDPRSALKGEIGFVSADRQREGLILVANIAENIGAVRPREWSVMSMRSARRLAEIGRSYITRFSIQARGPFQSVRTLSGGNQQKVVLAKTLFVHPNVLLLEEPTRGVDVHAKVEIYRVLRELTRQGFGVMMFSPELPEILAECDRVIVLRRGSIVADAPATGLNEVQLLTLSVGGNQT